MFFKSKETSNKNSDLIKVAALLIHAAKIDENFSEQEEKIIKETLLNIGANPEDLEEVIINAKKNEENANQILEFTKQVKNMAEEDKERIVESLWKIIYSNNTADIYETSLMRRLAGLLYIDNKTMGDIKEKIRKENSQ